MKSLDFTDSASKGRIARVGRVFGSAVFAVVMGASIGAQAGELDAAQPEDVLVGVNAVIDDGLGDQRGAGLLNRRGANGGQGAGGNGVVGQGSVTATSTGSGSAVGVSAGSLGVAISTTTINQTATQTANFGTGGAGGTP